MIRVYLDQNILSELKKKEGGHYKNLLTKITQYRKDLIIPYSPAHISDLLKGLKGRSSNEDVIKNDLDFLSVITNDQLLTYYFDRENITTKTRRPHELFEERRNDYLTPWLEQLDFTGTFDMISQILEGERKTEFDSAMSLLMSKFSNSE